MTEPMTDERLEELEKFAEGYPETGAYSSNPTLDEACIEIRRLKVREQEWRIDHESMVAALKRARVENEKLCEQLRSWSDASGPYGS